LQFNGLPRGVGETYNTWTGARFSASELLEFAGLQDFQVLALEDASTQYLWTTWRKQPAGWRAGLQQQQEAESSSEVAESEPAVRIRRITNATSSEPLAPCRGRFASISLWIENLPADAGLHHLRVTVGENFGTVIYVGPRGSSGLQQVTVILPELEATGLLPVELRWLGRPIGLPATLRVIPPPPSVPRICSVSDGVNLVAGNRCETRTIKIVLEEIARPHEIEATIGGFPAQDLEFFCTDPRPQRFEVNFRLPEQVGPGQHPLQVSIGRRKLAPVTIEVAG
jgi:hypothetical protein